MRNCASEVWSFGPSRNDGSMDGFVACAPRNDDGGRGEGQKQLRRVGKGALALCPPFLLKDAGGHAALCPPCVSAMTMERARGKSNASSGCRVRSMPVRESLHRD